MSSPKTSSSGANPVSRCVLIGVDGSDHSDKALRYYLDWLVRPNDSVTLFCVIEPPSLPAFSITSLSSVPTEEWGKIMQTRVLELANIENNSLADCLAKRVNARFLTQDASHVGEAIVKQADKQAADLVVLGSRGLGAVKRTILGSVSDYVLHHIDRPVCVIPQASYSARRSNK
ncbi:unnamed protein product [Protopolystoma xenopodis]|uniref:UspA domain-containing protein n=1 Tax=Protopolystoma xenopodis TaxID=117903 RepID=A0A3S5AAH6_9PLAT|nr:unnamed protein product [Protopolystoma xenopodis]